MILPKRLASARATASAAAQSPESFEGQKKKKAETARRVATREVLWEQRLQ